MRAKRRSVVASAAAAGALCLLLGLPGAATSNDPFGESWPAGEGRELTGAWCGGCHSLNLVTQQGMTRDGWDELLHWMTEKQNMPPLEGDRRDQVLDYLAANFDTGRGERRVSADGEVPIPEPVQGIRLPPLEIRPAD